MSVPSQNCPVSYFLRFSEHIHILVIVIIEINGQEKKNIYFLIDTSLGEIHRNKHRILTEIYN